MNSHASEVVDGGMWTVRETAEFLRLAVSTIYQLMAAGDLPFAKIGRSRRIPRRAVIEFAAGKMTEVASIDPASAVDATKLPR